MKRNLHLDKIDADKFADNILSLLNSNKPEEFLFADIVLLVQEETQIESVGLRLQEGFDYPYYVTRGFSLDFVEKENFLCRLDHKGNRIKGPHGLPELECMCGNIIRGKVDPSLPYFTAEGSFWTNSTSDFIAESPITELQGKTRNRCNKEGYESVALIPVKDVQTYGLLQLNDRKRNLYTLKFIKLMEWVAASIGILISYLRQQKKSQSASNDHRKYQIHKVIGPIKPRK